MMHPHEFVTNKNYARWKLTQKTEKVTVIEQRDGWHGQQSKSEKVDQMYPTMTTTPSVTVSQ
jgi:hypothetical protein